MTSKLRPMLLAALLIAIPAMIGAPGMAGPAAIPSAIPGADSDGPTVPAADLLVLRESGRTQDGLPVLEPSPRSAEIAPTLMRGFFGDLLRLYAMEQEYLRQREGREPQPAVLLLSKREGGFPCRGFVLDGQVLRDLDYVDLHEDLNLAGSFGAMDQIFPHELAHVMVRELAGEQEAASSNQVHAIGVTTDPGTAFSEGFAEHMQIMALDHPDADARTKALLTTRRSADWATETLCQYRRELTARAAWFTPRRVGFMLWFSRAEQIERYYQVKENLFARSVVVPDRLLRSRDPHPAYLLENILPGHPNDPPKSTSRMLSTEGVISCLFYRWATSSAMQQSYRDDAFYRSFGVVRKQVRPDENVYLKLMHAFHETKPHTAQEAIIGYLQIFPEDSSAVKAIVRETFSRDLPLRDLSSGDAWSICRPIWLANAGFRVGTSLFDQFRSLPQVHLFELNSAGAADLAAVPGMTPAMAAEIKRRQPLADLEALAAIPGMPPELLSRFRDMATAATAARAAATTNETMESRVPLSTIVRSYLLRALCAIVIATAAGAALIRLLGKRGRWTLFLRSLGATLVGLFAAWVISGGAPAVIALLTVGLVLGVPGAIWSAIRTRSGAKALRSLLIWIVAAVPAAILVTPWF